MPARPWVTPEEVKEYSSEPCISSRTEARLRMDISRAESYILAYTRNKGLLDDNIYPTIPDDIRNAVIILAEYYGVQSVNRGYTSESFDDYSYSKDASTAVDISLLGLDYLLDDYIISEGSGKITLEAFIV